MWSSVLQQVLSIILPPLAVAGVAYIVAWINKEAKKLSADQMYAIKEAVTMGVNFAEQTGLLKTGVEKKADALSAAQEYLKKQGIAVDLALLDNMIEAAVKTEVNWNVPVTPSEPVQNVGVTSTVTVTPPVAPVGTPSEPE
jgi:Tfp pilus assembly protein PilZ